jgi:nucleotide-binding universal stress UspA family protein
MFRLVFAGIAGKEESASESAVRHGAHLAARHGAGFAVLHVSPPLNREGSCVLQLPSKADLAARRDNVEGLCRRVMPAGLTADVMIESGFPHVEIQKALRLMTPDLVVMGGHGDAERCRLELGNAMDDAALIVARDASCPVLVAPAEGQAFNGAFRRVLAVTNFSFAATPLMTLANRLAEAGGADLRAFHPIALPPGTPLPPASELSGMIDRAGERLVNLGCALHRPVTTGVREGEPAREILKDAREYGADLVVLATDEYGPAAIDGPSVAMQVLAGARCAVLLAGPQALAAQKRTGAAAALGGAR